MFKFRLFPPHLPPFLILFTLLTLFLCPSSYISAINTEVRFHSTSSLRQINGSVSVWIFFFLCVCVCVSQKWCGVSIHVSVQLLWPVALFAPWSVKVTGSKLTARSLGLDVKVCSVAYSPFQLRTQRSRPSALCQSSSWDVHHHDFFPHSVSFHDKLHRRASFMKSLWPVCSLYCPTTESHRRVFSISSCFLKFDYEKR